MSSDGTVFLHSLATLAESAQRLAAAVECGDWDAVGREIETNAICFERLCNMPQSAQDALDKSQRARATELMSEIVAANDGAVGRISPRLTDMKQLLATLSA